ncbi:MAG: flagellar motor switch protein FliM [Armatimonadota bacterium]|nr:flagellar motor switch protein FliM [Armatimonadota bacterium]
MGEILSQAEIDALLSALHSGEVSLEGLKPKPASREAKPYDFRRPDRFSKDQIRTLSMIYGTFARLFSTSLSVYLRTNVQVLVLSVDQLTYDEFVRSIPNPTVMFILDLAPLDGQAILEVNTSLALQLIDRLLGGPGIGTGKARPLTDIEQALIERIVEKALVSLKESWQTIIPLQPRIKALEMNPQFAHIVAPSDIVLLVTMEAKVSGQSSLMNMCLPYILLQPVLSRLSATTLFATREGKRDEKVLLRVLQGVKVPVRVKLGEALITVRELLELRPNDVIRLDRGVDQLLEVIIGRSVKFLGRPGQVRRRLGVETVMRVEEPR